MSGSPARARSTSWKRSRRNWEMFTSINRLLSIMYNNDEHDVHFRLLATAHAGRRPETRISRSAGPDRDLKIEWPLSFSHLATSRRGSYDALRSRGCANFRGRPRLRSSRPSKFKIGVVLMVVINAITTIIVKSVGEKAPTL